MPTNKRDVKSDVAEGAPLPEHFRSEVVGSAYHLHCRKCDAGWAYPKDKEPTPGALLHLLNHARSHV